MMTTLRTPLTWQAPLPAPITYFRPGGPVGLGTPYVHTVAQSVVVTRQIMDDSALATYIRDKLLHDFTRWIIAQGRCVLTPPSLMVTDAHPERFTNTVHFHCITLNLRAPCPFPSCDPCPRLTAFLAWTVRAKAAARRFASTMRGIVR